MSSSTRLHAAEAFKSAFQVAPEVAAELPFGRGVGVYGWTTPEMQGFELPETEDLIVALHLGGSRRVRAITDQGLSQSYSSPGLVTILPPGQPVAFRTDGSIRVMTLHLPAQALGADPIAQLAGASTQRFAFRDTYVRAAMEVMLDAAHFSGDQNTEYLKKVSDALILHLARAIENGPAKAMTAPALRLGEQSLSKVLSYVEANLSEKLSLDQLAQAAGVSRAKLTRSFKLATGCSAHQYVTLRRIEAAKRLLRETEMDIAGIAQDTGFCSQSHFTGLFHQIAGCTPRRFRDEAG